MELEVACLKGIYQSDLLPHVYFISFGGGLCIKVVCTITK